MSEHTPKVDRFNGENYALWKIKVRAVLVREDLWEVVTGKEEEWVDRRLRGSKKKEDAEEATREWRRRQEKALATIQLLVTDPILVKIGECQTAAETFAVLDGEFQSKTGINRLLLKQKLYTLRLAEEESVDTYLGEIDQILQQLAAVNSKIEEEDAALALLLGLPASWANFKTSICISSEKTGLKLPEVKAAIRTENLTRKVHESSIPDLGERAFYTRTKPQPKCGECGLQGHETKDCNTVCRKCGEKGHIKKNCKVVSSFAAAF